MTREAMGLQSRETNDGILNRILPPRIDNGFRGHWLAPWLFGAYAFAKAGQGVDSIFNTYAVATGPDGIPLASLGAAAAQTVLQLFALLGLHVLILPALGLLALIRYRAMIPLLSLTMVVLYLAAKLVAMLHPDPPGTNAHPLGFYVNLGLLAVLLVGFALSIMRSPSRAPETRAAEPAS
jgi:hypothetical protein